MNFDSYKVLLLLAENEMKKGDLADKINVSSSYLNVILKRGSANTATLGRMARALGVSVRELLPEG